jgi:hypothetical protein
MTTPTPEPVRPERSFPPRCPDCQRLMADTGKPHCKDNDACDWLRCTCGAVVNQVGTWTNGLRRGEAA